MNDDIVNYIKEGMRRGFSVGLLKQKLLEAGFNEREVEEAAKSVEQKSPVVIQQKNYLSQVQQNKPLRSSGDEMIHGELGIFKKMGKALAHPTELFGKTKRSE